MDKKLSPKEEALLAAARREAAARRPGSPAPAPAQPKPAASPAERLALLMEAERAETLERKKKMRRYGLGISGAILAMFVVWLLSSFRRPRRK
jgi:hypothetical protein